MHVLHNFNAVICYIYIYIYTQWFGLSQSLHRCGFPVDLFHEDGAQHGNEDREAESVKTFVLYQKPLPADNLKK